MGHKEIVALLVEKGADVNAENKNLGTPLFLAIQNEKYEVAKYLIQKGASPNFTSPSGYTALHLISSEYIQDPDEKVELAKLLIEKGAQIDKTNYFRLTPLQCAIKHRQNYGLGIVKLLLEKGAKGCNLTSLLETMIQENNHDMATFLVPYISELDSSFDEKCYLHDIIRQGYRHLAKMLIDKGASIEATDELDCTPLHTAAEYGQITMAIFLIEKGCNVNSLDANDDTPLHFAIKHNHTNK